MLMMPAMPLRNSKVDAVYAAKLFSDEECDKIQARTEDARWSTGTVKNAEGTFVETSGSRTADLHPVASDPQGYPLSKVMQIVSGINSEFWSYDLSGLMGDDMPSLMRYREDVQGHYDWHTDVGPGPMSSRKLGFTLQLSDGGKYVGGDLEFYKSTLPSDKIRERGTLILFSSFWLHRVSPVTSGERVAMVGWIHGPSFR